METRLVHTTDVEATAAQIRERIGRYDFLRITEDAKGLHVYNIRKQAELMLYRVPLGLFGHACYGHILHERSGDFHYLDKKGFGYALQKLFAVAEEIMQGKA